MASLRQSLDAFGHNMLPLTGVVGFQIPLLSMDTSQQVLSHVSQEHGKTLGTRASQAIGVRSLIFPG